MARLLIIQLFFFISCICTSFGQGKENTSPLNFRKHGFNTYTATTIPAGYFLAETEFTWFRNNRRYLYNISAGLPQVNLRIGITQRLEISLGTSFNYNTTRFRSTGESCLFCTTWYGNDYIIAGFRAKILRYNKGNGLLTLSGETYIPGTKGAKVMAMGKTPRLQLINSGRLGNNYGYLLNLGSSTKEDSVFVGFLNLSGAATWNPSERIIIFTGLSHEINTKPKDYGPVANFVTAAEGGFLYSVLPNLQLQAAAGVSMTNSDQKADFFAKTGLAWGIDYSRH